MLALSGTHPERHVLWRALGTFYASAAASAAPEIHRLATTVETWWPAIKAAILTRHSKGLSVELRSGVHHEVLTPLLNHGPRKFRAVPGRRGTRRSARS